MNPLHSYGEKLTLLFITTVLYGNIDLLCRVRGPGPQLHENLLYLGALAKSACIASCNRVPRHSMIVSFILSRLHMRRLVRQVTLSFLTHAEVLPSPSCKSTHHRTKGGPIAIGDWDVDNIQDLGDTCLSQGFDALLSHLILFRGHAYLSHSRCGRALQLRCLWLLRKLGDFEISLYSNWHPLKFGIARLSSLFTSPLSSSGHVSNSARLVRSTPPALPFSHFSTKRYRESPLRFCYCIS